LLEFELPIFTGSYGTVRRLKSDVKQQRQLRRKLEAGDTYLKICCWWAAGGLLFQARDQ